MALLVAVQMSWAGAQLCCVAELGEQRQAALLEQPGDAETGEAHKVCETGHCHCHHAGCAAPMDDAGYLPATQPAPLQPGLAAHPESHVPPGLERPNWLRA